MLVFADRITAGFAAAIAVLALLALATQYTGRRLDNRLPALLLEGEQWHRAALDVAAFAAALLCASALLFIIALNKLLSPKLIILRAVSQRIIACSALAAGTYVLSINSLFQLDVGGARPFVPTPLPLLVRWLFVFPLQSELTANVDELYNELRSGRAQQTDAHLRPTITVVREFVVQVFSITLHVLGRMSDGGRVGFALGLAAPLPWLYTFMHAFTTTRPQPLEPSLRLARLAPPRDARAGSEPDRFLTQVAAASACCMLAQAALGAAVCVAPPHYMRAATAAQVLFVLLEPLYAVLMPLARTLNLALEVQAANEDLTQALLVDAARAEGDARAVAEKRASAMRRQFLRVSFHELRGPLNSCSLAIEALRGLMLSMAAGHLLPPGSAAAQKEGAGALLEAGAGAPATAAPQVSDEAAAVAAQQQQLEAAVAAAAMADMLAEGQTLCDMALAGCSTASTILNSVLSLSAIESGGEFKLRCAPASLRVIAQHVHFQMQPWANAANVRLQLDLPVLSPASGSSCSHPLDSVYADASRLQQVLTNWVSNSLKLLLHDGSGRVVIRVGYHGTAPLAASYAGRPCAEARSDPACPTGVLPPGYAFTKLVVVARLEVQDNGPGIAPGQQAKLLRSLQQLQEPGSPRQLQQSGSSLPLQLQQAPHRSSLHVEAEAAVVAEAAAAVAARRENLAAEGEKAEKEEGEGEGAPWLFAAPSLVGFEGSSSGGTSSSSSLLRRRRVAQASSQLHAGGAASSSGGGAGPAAATTTPRGARSPSSSSESSQPPPRVSRLPRLRSLTVAATATAAADVGVTSTTDGAVATAAAAAAHAATSPPPSHSSSSVRDAASRSPVTAAAAATVFELEPSFGLGLGITRSIIDAYGGTVGLRSTPGCGATFFCDLTLPVLAFTPSALLTAAPADDDAAAAVSRDGAPPPLRRLRAPPQPTHLLDVGGGAGGLSTLLTAGGGALPPPPPHLEGEPHTLANLLSMSPMVAGGGGGGGGGGLGLLFSSPVLAAVTARALPPPPPPPPVRPPSVLSRPPRFLVAEDEPLNRKLLVRVLRSRWPDALVLEAQDGELALQAYLRMGAEQQAAAAAAAARWAPEGDAAVTATGEGGGADARATRAPSPDAPPPPPPPDARCFDVILLDCQMPRKTGLDTAREIRALEAAAAVAAAAAASSTRALEAAHALQLVADVAAVAAVAAAAGVAAPLSGSGGGGDAAGAMEAARGPHQPSVRDRSLSATHPLRPRRVGIIGITGNALLEDQTAFLAAGADEVLIKPVLAASVYAAIERRLREMAGRGGGRHG